MRKRFIFNVYTFIGLKKRVGVQFPGKKYGVPHSQVFQNHLYTSVEDNARYLNDFKVVIAKRTPHKWRRYFGKDPISFKQNNDSFVDLMRKGWDGYPYTVRPNSRTKIVDETPEIKDLVKQANAEIKKQKDYYVDLREDFYEYSEVYSEVKSDSAFEVRGLLDFVNEKDANTEINKIAGREIFDAKRGDADTLLLRAKRRRALLELRRQREEGKIKYIVIEDYEDDEEDKPKTNKK